MTHGSIDGYRRTVTFLKCADNNRACTPLSAFMNAVYVHGLPECFRTDLGGENVEIWRFMVEQRVSTAAVITGSSTHNERIERLWRDVHRCVAVLFHDTFYSLEHEDKLDPLTFIVCITCICHALIQHCNHSLNLGTTTPSQLNTILPQISYLLEVLCSKT